MIWMAVYLPPRFLQVFEANHEKDGCIRLRLPADRKSLSIWDTPGPPTHCRFTHGTTETSRRLAAWQRFGTARLDSVDGLTFFFSQDRLLAVYPHRSDRDCAITACRRLSRQSQQHLVWVYFPVAHSDTVTALAVRHSKQGRNILVSRHALFVDSN